VSFVTCSLVPSADRFWWRFRCLSVSSLCCFRVFLDPFLAFLGPFSGPCFAYFRGLVGAVFGVPFFDIFLSDGLCRVFTASLSVFGFWVFFFWGLFGAIFGAFFAVFGCFALLL